MAQFLPAVEKKPSFSESIGASLSQGLSQGANLATKLASESYLEKQKADQRQKLIQRIETEKQGTPNQAGQNDFMSQLQDKKSEIEHVLGFKLTDDQLSGVAQQLQRGSPQNPQEQDPFMKAKQYAVANEHDLASIATKEAESNIKTNQKEKEFHTDRSFKFLDKVNEQEEKLPEREAALASAFSAVDSGQMAPLGGDFWANLTGIKSLGTESGAQLNAAAKANLMGSLNRLSGARPTVFLEKQISDSFAQVGETPGQQKAKLLIAKSILDMDKNHSETANSIASEHRKKYGYPKESLSEETNAAVKKTNQKIMKNLSYDLQRNMEKSIKPDNFNRLIKVPKGTPLTIEKARVILSKSPGKTEEEKEINAHKIAKKLGYEIPGPETYERE